MAEGASHSSAGRKSANQSEWTETEVVRSRRAVGEDAFQSRGQLTLAFSQQYIGLQILEKLIQTRWKALPADQRTGESRLTHQAEVAASDGRRRWTAC